MIGPTGLAWGGVVSEKGPDVPPAAVVGGGVYTQQVAHEGVDVGGAEGFGNVALLEGGALGDEERVHGHDGVVVAVRAQLGCAEGERTCDSIFAI